MDTFHPPARTTSDSIPTGLRRTFPEPAIVTSAGPAAVFAWDEFFTGTLRNLHSRKAYTHAVRVFLSWLDNAGIALSQVTPAHVGGYLDRLAFATPTRKLTLAALRRFFDILVLRHVLILNPAHSVRVERYQVIEGKTPEATPEQARTLLASIDTTTVVGLRDKAILATLMYTAARVGAVARLRRKDLVHDGTQYVLHFQEKGGKQRQLPVRHDLQSYLLDYLATTGADLQPTSPLFRSTIRRTGVLTDRALTGTDLWRLVKRRLADAGLPSHLSPHSFRVAVVTDLLVQGVPLADVQYLAGHSDPRTTRLYDRRHQKVSRNLVERISI